MLVLLGYTYDSGCTLKVLPIEVMENILRMAKSIDIVYKRYGRDRTSVAWSIRGRVTYDDIVELFLSIDKADFIEPVKDKLNKRKDKWKGFLELKELIEEYLFLFQAPDNFVEIKTRNGKERFVIYTLCKVFGYPFQKILSHCKRLIGCNQFSFTGGCGCGNVPSRFAKYRAGNNYEDTVAYYKIPYTYKEGVVVFKNDKGREEYLKLKI